jgi:glyceraldehyde 3-phosphate dehydrogenase
MRQLKIGINGFGRIGRTFLRLLYENTPHKVVVINDLGDAKTLAHLLKYDSIHGICSQTIEHSHNTIVVNGAKSQVLNYNNPADIDWKTHNVDIVIEATGKFKKKHELQQHISNGAKKVILTVPPTDDAIKMTVIGVNEHMLSKEDHIISNASCTTNNAAPMIKVINDLCGIEQAYITTVHSYTSDQSLHDRPHRDLRRSRAAAQSIIPTTTGAAKALTKIFPELSNVIGGCGIRVPVPNGSLTDITFNVKKQVSIHQVNDAFKNAATNNLKGILQYTDEPIVSIDINNSYHSCTFDSQMTSVISKMIKIIGWYDNETGYCARLLDLIALLSKKNYI